MTFRATRALALLASAFIVMSCNPYPKDPVGRTTIFLAPGPGETANDFQIRVRQAFNLVQPGTILEFGEGTFAFTTGLSVSASHVIIKGQGMDKTVLDFDASDSSVGITVTGDHFLIRDIAVIEAPGDGVKAIGIDGFTARRLKVDWAAFESEDNGRYGIYPVLCQNVLIEYSAVYRSSDAGIYVGQSDNILIRWNYVEGNVAGIETENTIGAEVVYNVATKNAGGILSFDLPGLSQAGTTTRVHKNWVYDNNGKNFASGILELVPSGTGILVIATDDVEVFDNEVHDHKTVGIGVVSYELTLDPNTPADFDQWPEKTYVHDNNLSNNATEPQGLVGQVVAFQFFPENLPEVFWDGARNPAFGLGTEEYLPLDLRYCVQNLNGVVWGRMSTTPLGSNATALEAKFDASPYDCSHAPVPAVVMPPEPPLPELEQQLTPEETAALCGAETIGVNWDAFEANCPFLSDFNLFTGNDPRGPVTEAGLEYELTTPLFSDYSNKYRFVFVPAGEAAVYDADEVFDFPVGTIISKTFGFDLVGGGERVVETRLLIRREAGWRSLVYLWDGAMTAAGYTPEGSLVEVTFDHPDDGETTINYSVPDTNQCAGCHQGVADAVNVIGPKARLLNRPSPGAATNQLEDWEAAGILIDLPVDLTSVDRLPVWNDPGDGTLEERARAYLESNCAHCHRPGGRAGFTGLWLDIATVDESQLGFCKTPIAAGPGTGGLDFDIVPGEADLSVLAFRLNSAEPGVEMPELAKSIVHDAGVALVADWINSLPPGPCSTPE